MKLVLPFVAALSVITLPIAAAHRYDYHYLETYTDQNCGKDIGEIGLYIDDECVNADQAVYSVKTKVRVVWCVSASTTRAEASSIVSLAS